MASSNESTYVFRAGKVYTFVAGKVVASVKESDFADPAAGHQIQSPVEMPPPPPDLQGDLGEASTCPECGSPSSPQDHFCPTCGASLSTEGIPSNEADLYGMEPPQHAEALAHIVTPNGLKGKVLGRTKGLWGDEVTVRFENGQIRRLAVHKDLEFVKEAASEVAPLESLESRLATEVQGDKDSLEARIKELASIKAEASAEVADASDEDAAALNKLVVVADYEAREVKDALQHLAELEGRGFEPPAPIENLPEVEQETMGPSRQSGTWLGQTLGEMVGQANATDYKKLMDEGPEAFVAGLDPEVIPDAVTVRDMASREIRSRTAGTENIDLRNRYEKVWLHRIEEQRRKAFASHRETQLKQAAVEDAPIDTPDEGLFL